MVKAHYTTTEICELYHVSDWQARRAIDALGDVIPRAGRSRYRLVPASVLPAVEAELRRRNYLRGEVVNA